MDEHGAPGQTQKGSQQRVDARTGNLEGTQKLSKQPGIVLGNLTEVLTELKLARTTGKVQRED